MHPSPLPGRAVAVAAAGLLASFVVILGPSATASASPSPRPAASAAPASTRTSGSDDDPSVMRWTWPVGPPVVLVAPFRAPPTPYAAGHRGIDLAATPGGTVVAADDGVVSFAGPVVGRGVLSIDHGRGVVSSIEPVAAAVAAGDAVRAGQTVATVDAGGHCHDDCVHFGVRIHGEYVSPLLMFGGVPRAVLLPMGR